MTHEVRVNEGHDRLLLPNGTLYDGGAVVTLTDGQFALIPTSAFFNGVLTDLTGHAPSPPALPGAFAPSRQVVAKTTAYAATVGDVVLADATAAGFTVTLPAPAPGAVVSVKKVDAGANVVTVAQHAAEDIDGAGSYDLDSQYLSRDFLSDGTDWWVV